MEGVVERVVVYYQYRSRGVYLLRTSAIAAATSRRVLLGVPISPATTLPSLGGFSIFRDVEIFGIAPPTDQVSAAFSMLR